MFIDILRSILAYQFLLLLLRRFFDYLHGPHIVSRVRLSVREDLELEEERSAETLIHVLVPSAVFCLMST